MKKRSIANKCSVIAGNPVGEKRDLHQRSHSSIPEGSRFKLASGELREPKDCRP